MTPKEMADKKTGYTFSDLVWIMATLRGENGCPWDREQTHKSIRKNLIEETYEVVEAIDNDDPILMCEELGDLILQAVFHAEMAKEQGRFDISDVCDGICRKLIIRHPHIFADTVAETSDDVLVNWDIIKQQTKKQKTVSEKLNSFPPSLPALMRAYKTVEKSAKAGYTLEKNESCQAIDINRKADEAEIGRLLISVVCLAKNNGIDPEEALYHATDRFVSDFEKAEKLALDTKKSIFEAQ